MTVEAFKVGDDLRRMISSEALVCLASVRFHRHITPARIRGKTSVDAMTSRSGCYYIEGDDEDLKQIFIRLALVKHRLEPIDHRADSCYERRDDRRPLFAVHMGTINVERAIFLEHTTGCDRFTWAGVMANEVLEEDTTPSETASLAFLFAKGTDGMGRRASEVFSDFGASANVGGLLTILQAEQARLDPVFPPKMNLHDVRAILAASALTACIPDPGNYRATEHWQILSFNQCPPPSIKPSQTRKKFSVCVFGCGILGQEFAKRFARCCPQSVDEVYLVDPSSITEWDAQHYFKREGAPCIGKAAVAGENFRADPKRQFKVKAIENGIREASANPDEVKSAMGNSDLWINCVTSVGVARLIAQASADYSKHVVDVACYPSEEHPAYIARSSCGQVRVYLPRLTESMNCQHESSPFNQPPLCVVASFPYESTHAIYWALDKLVKTWDKVIKEGRVLTVEECIARARKLFEKWYHFRVRRLLRTFPPDFEDASTGLPYWSFPKMVPKVAEFDARNPEHLEFIRLMAQYIATASKFMKKASRRVSDARSGAGDTIAHEMIIMSDPRLRDVLTRVPVPEFETEELKDQRRTIDDDLSKTYSSSSLGSSTPALRKDDARSLQLIVSVAGLRCRNYDIDIPGGNIITKLTWEISAGHGMCDVGACSVAASLAATAACSVLEVLGDEDGGGNESEARNKLFNCTFSTSPMTVESWTPPPPSALLVVDAKTYTVWDKLTVKGSKALTFGQLCDDVKRVFRQDMVSMVNQDKRLLYMSGMTPAKTLEKPAQEVLKSPISDSSHVDLLFAFESSSGDDDVMAPPVRYEWDFS